MFSSRSFIVSGLTFRSLIHFEFIFVYGVRKCSSFILLQGGIGMGNTCKPMAISFQCMTKSTTNKKKKNINNKKNKKEKNKKKEKKKKKKTPDETGQILRERRDPQLFRDFLNSLCLLSFTHFNPSLGAEPHALMLQIKEPSVLL